MQLPDLSAEEHLASLYLGTIFFVAVVGGWLLTFLLKRTENRRIDRVEKLVQFLPTEVEAVSEKSARKGREQAVEFIETRFTLFRRILLPGLWLFCGVVAILPFIGKIPATFLTVLVGIVTVLAGIAAKPLMENLFSGILISLTQPIRIGDILEIDSHYGIVEDIGVSHTTIKLWNWGRYLIPNSQLIGSRFTNLTLHDRFLWARVTFWVGTDAPLSKVRSIALHATEELKRCNQLDGDIGFWIVGESQTGVECWVAFWVNHPIKAWNLRTDLRIALAENLSAAGIRSNSYFMETRPGSPHHTPQDGPPPAGPVA